MLKKILQTKTRSLIIFVVTIVVIGTGIALLNSKKNNIEDQEGKISNTANVPTGIKSTPGSKTSPRYKELQEKENIKGSKEADKTGDTFIPTVVSSEDDIDDLTFQANFEKSIRGNLGCSTSSAKSLLDNGDSITEIAEKMREQGCNAKEISKALHELNFSAEDITEALLDNFNGESCKDIANAIQSIYKSGNNKNCGAEAAKKLERKGYNINKIALEMKNNGCSANDIAKALTILGYDTNEIATALKNAKFLASDINSAIKIIDDLNKKCGPEAALNLQNLGYTLNEIVIELKEQGCSANNIARTLEELGYSIEDINKALLNAGFNPDEIKTAIELLGDEQSKNLSELNEDEKNRQSAEDLALKAQQEELEREKTAALREAHNRTIQEVSQAMETQKGEAFAAWNDIPTQTLVTGEYNSNKKQNNNSENNSLNGNKNGKNNQEHEPSYLKAGSIIFAVLETSVNSDEPGPIMARIVSGKLKGSRVIGTMSLGGDNAEKANLSFNQINIPDQPKSYALSAVAIDPDSARTAIASSVDHHYLLRWGSLFASSFLEGYASAVGSSGETQTTNQNASGSTTTTTKPALNGRQQLFEGLGKVGAAWGEKIGKNTDRKPTITIKSGTGIGILLTSDFELGKLPTKEEDKKPNTTNNTATNNQLNLLGALLQQSQQNQTTGEQNGQQ